MRICKSALFDRQGEDSSPSVSPSNHWAKQCTPFLRLPDLNPSAVPLHQSVMQPQARCSKQCPADVCWPAGYITQDAIIEEDVLLSIRVDTQCWDAGSIVVDHHDAGAIETLGLMHQQVAAFIVHIVSNDEALWKVEEWDKTFKLRVFYVVICSTSISKT